MKANNRKEKLYQRQRDFDAGPKGNDRSKQVQWGGENAAFHKPGSNGRK